MLHKCKLCPFTATGPKYIELLREHWLLDHPKEYREITEWLARTTDERERAAAKLAKEGMGKQDGRNHINSDSAIRGPNGKKRHRISHKDPKAK